MLKVRNLRRLSAALIAPAVAAGVLVAAPSAQAAPNSNSDSSARWLSSQLTDGLIHNPNFGGFDDYGLSIDVFYTLSDLGTGAADRAAIIAALKTNAAAYSGSGTDIYAGATGKLASAAQTAGAVATDFGGVDLIAQAEGRVTTTGSAAGRATDSFDPTSTWGADYSNTIGQSWVVRALSTAGSSLAAETINYLLKQQCNDGSFRTAMNDASCTTGAGTIDATAFAIEALGVAKKAGQPNLQDDINAAVAWLLKQQQANGAFLNDGEANSNTTGLAAATLKKVGQNVAADSAATWILSNQVTVANSAGNALASEVGAIAFDQDALAAGKLDGITEAIRDQWIRATSQAAVGINALLPAKKLSLAVPSGYIRSGSTITVSTSGLAAGEKFTASIAGGTTVTGKANAAGVASAKVKVPAKTANRVVTIKGVRSNRVGSKTAKVLAAKKFSLSLKSKVNKGKKQSLKVSGLAAGEKLKVYVAGKRIKTAKANSKGKYTLSFKVTGKKGKKTVKVIGQFSNRSTSKKFTAK